MQEPQPKTIKLQHPIQVGGATIEQVTMRPPRVRDLRAAQRAAGSGALPGELDVALHANLCEIAPAAIEEMHMVDFRRIQDAYEGFLSRGSTGGTPARS